MTLIYVTPTISYSNLLTFSLYYCTVPIHMTPSAKVGREMGECHVHLDTFPHWADLFSTFCFQKKVSHS